VTATASQSADAGAFGDLGAVLHLQGDASASVEALTRAIALDPTAPQLLVNRGWSCEALDRLEDARADFAHALELDPSRAEASAGLAYVEARLRRPAVAQQRAGLAVLHGGSDYLILHNVACTYAQLAVVDTANAGAHEDTAIALLTRALELWRSAPSGPDERELIAREITFTSLRNQPKFEPLLRSR
jgi:tetratricopeptide (TPR) repeat protein